MQPLLCKGSSEGAELVSRGAATVLAQHHGCMTEGTSGCKPLRLLAKSSSSGVGKVVDTKLPCWRNLT